MKLYRSIASTRSRRACPLLLQLPVFISLYAAIKGLGPAQRARVPAVGPGAQPRQLPVDPAPRQPGSLLHPARPLRRHADDLHRAHGGDRRATSTQKWIMRAMPIMFVLFLFRFPAGLFVYWVTTNVWTIGQQLIIRRTMPKPEELAAQAKAKPKKRSRFMEAMMASQGEAMKQREEQMAKKGDGAARQAGLGRRPARSPRPAPRSRRPARRKRKQARRGRQARPGRRQARPGGAGQQGKPAGGQQPRAAAGRQAGGRRARARAATEERPRARTVRRTSDAAGRPRLSHPTREQDRWKSRTTSSRSTKRKKRPSSPPSPAGPPSRRPSARRSSSCARSCPTSTPPTSSTSSSRRAARAASSAAARCVAQVEARLRPSDERVEADLPEGAETLREFIQTIVDLMGIEAHVGASETPRVRARRDQRRRPRAPHRAPRRHHRRPAVHRRDRRQRRPPRAPPGDRRRGGLPRPPRRRAHGARRPHRAEGRARVGEHRPQADDAPRSARSIHLHLKDHPRVETVSEGNEPFRAVVVSPRQPSV